MGSEDRFGEGGPELAPSVDAYDRLEARAWTVARWITGDDALAADAVIAVFGVGSGTDRDWSDDAAVLRDVRWRALERTPARGVALPAAPTATLPAEQREVVELAVVGRVHPNSIARLTRRRARDVCHSLAGGMRQLALSVASEPERLQV